MLYESEACPSKEEDVIRLEKNDARWLDECRHKYFNGHKRGEEHICGRYLRDLINQISFIQIGMPLETLCDSLFATHLRCQ